MRALVSSLLAVLLALPCPALAQPSSEEVKSAKMHYDNAEAAMREGRHEGAIAEYVSAFEIIKDPFLFYKIGLAYQAAGKCDKALIYYKRYLREGKPTGDFQVAVEERIAQCSAAGKPAAPTTTGGAAATTTTTPTTTPGPETSSDAPADAAGTAEAPETPEPGDAAEPLGTDPSFLDERPSMMRSAGWVLMGTTVAFLTAGTILAMSGQSREEDLESLAAFRDPRGMPATYEGNVQARYDDLVDEGERFNTWATIAFVAAGVTAATSATLLILDARRGGSGESGSAITRSITPVLGRDLAGVAARIQF